MKINWDTECKDEVSCRTSYFTCKLPLLGPECICSDSLIWQHWPSDVWACVLGFRDAGRPSCSWLFMQFNCSWSSGHLHTVGVGGPGSPLFPPRLLWVTPYLVSCGVKVIAGFPSATSFFSCLCSDIFSQCWSSFLVSPDPLATGLWVRELSSVPGEDHLHQPGGAICLSPQKAQSNVAWSWHVKS